jgi:hypothetical protein
MQRDARTRAPDEEAHMKMAGGWQLGRIGGALTRTMWMAAALLALIAQAPPQPARAASCEFVTDTELHPAPAMPKPAYLVPYIDPVFGQKVTRVTGDPGDPVPNVGGTWGDRERHRYAMFASWNADGSLLFLNRENGDHDDLYLDGETYEVLFETGGWPGRDHRWHPTDPNLVLYITDNAIRTMNVWTNEHVTLAEFPGYTGFELEKSNPTDDGSRWAVLATNAAGQEVAFAYDMVTGEKFPDIPTTKFDSVGRLMISPLGNYLLMMGRSPEALDERGHATQVYDVRGQEVGPFWREYHVPGHYDLAIDGDGNEVAVGNAKTGAYDGQIITRRMFDGAIAPVTPDERFTHTSARNTLGNQEWIIGTAMGCCEPYKNEIVMARLDGSETRRLAHTHSVYNGYYTETHGSVSADGTKVVFASNWDDPDGPISAYVIEICAAEAVSDPPPPSTEEPPTTTEEPPTTTEEPPTTTEEPPTTTEEPPTTTEEPPADEPRPKRGKRLGHEKRRNR